MGKAIIKEQIILGLDPGTNVMGYGLIKVTGQKLSLLQFGVIHLKKYGTHELKLKKIFEPQNVSDEYNFWISHAAKECKKNQFICFFIDQPTGYKKNVSAELKKRFWMTPPYQDYTLSLDNLIQISSLYNNWLRDYTANNNLNFCSLSERMKPTTDNFLDDAHFSENGSKRVAEILSKCVKFSIDLSII